MESVPGTSSSSGGGDNLPPSKRGQMITLNNLIAESDQDSLDSDSGSLSGSSGEEGDLSSNKRSRIIPDNDNPSNPDSLVSDELGCVSSVMRVEPVHLKCVACEDYPPMEVFQCKEGHLICNKCIANIKRCPNCHVLYTQKKIRSLVAETYLDGMTFNCRFRSSGCLRTNLHRHQRTAHEIQCDHNPSPPGIKFCSLFDCSASCNFRIDTNSIIQDPQHGKDVIQHMTCFPHELFYRKTTIGERISLGVILPNSLGPHFKPLGLFEVCDATTRKTIGYYVLVRRISMPERKHLSFAVAGLNCAPVNLNCENRHSDKIKVTFSIKAKTDPDKVARDGIECVPLLRWTVKSIYLDEWEEWMMSPIEDRPSFSYSVPLSYLSEIYVREGGKYKLCVRFDPLVD